MNYKIGVIPGDGIGPEIVKEARRVLDTAAEKYGFSLEYTELLMGGASIDVHGIPLTDETIAEAKTKDAVLMGSIGGDAKTSPSASAGKASGGRTSEAAQVSEPVCKSSSGVSV